MAGKKKLHPIRQRAIDNVWRYGLTARQIRVVNALDKYSVQNPDEPSLYEIADMTRLSYGAVWTAVGVLEHFGYVAISRDYKGRAYRRGILFIHGFKLDEGLYDE